MTGMTALNECQFSIRKMYTHEKIWNLKTMITNALKEEKKTQLEKK